MDTPGAPTPMITWLTDVEGRWDKLVDFVRDNPCVALSTDGALTVSPGCVFVFGGDTVDRGPDGIRLVRTLRDVHARQPDQVVLLAGNRDVNKLRLPWELNGHPPSKTPAELRDAPAPVLLPWILANTMGAKEAFGHRRTELSRNDLPSDDAAVTASYLAEMAPDGMMSDYLARCQLAWRHGPSLFVHGFVTPENLGVVPGIPHRIDGIDAWVDALNGWYRQQMGFHRAGAMAEDGTPACGPLVAYQAPLPGTRANAASVVYARPTDATGTPHLPDTAVMAALVRDGVHRLLVGHTPTGDHPAVLRCPGFELVMGDNSYGRVETGSCVWLAGLSMDIRGVTLLDDGTRATVRLSTCLDDSDPWLGQRDAVTGALVKSRLDTGAYTLFRALAENTAEQTAARSDALADRVWVPPARPQV